MKILHHSRSLVLAGLIFALGNAAVAQLADEGSAQTLTLPQAITIALDRNIALQSSELTVSSRATSVASAQAEYRPDLSARVGESIGFGPEGDGSIFEGDGAWSDSTSASISSSLTLYDGGSREASLRLAQAELSAARREFDRDRQTLLFDVVSLYVQAVLRGKEIAIQEEERLTRIAELERIRADVENGIRTQSDLLRQQAQVSDSDRLLAQARNSYATSLFALKNALRLQPTAPIAPEDPATIMGDEADLPEPDLASSLAALETRVDLEAQRDRLISAEQSLRIAQSGKRPVVSASAGLSTGYSSDRDGGFDDQFLRNQPQASGGISISLPLFDRRRTELSAARSRIALEQEELFLESLQLSARTALFQAAQDFQTARLQLAASTEQLASAESALEAEQARYDAGAATLLDVNSLRSIRLDAAVAVEEARFSLFTSRLGVAYQDGTIESFLERELGRSLPTQN